jgi:hypothetical protein
MSHSALHGQSMARLHDRAAVDGDENDGGDKDFGLRQAPLLTGGPTEGGPSLRQGLLRIMRNLWGRFHRYGIGTMPYQVYRRTISTHRRLK